MLTVMFSTHNRHDALDGVMDAFVRVAAPEGGWKLIVVDNASTDGTGDKLRSYTNVLPLTVLEEPIAGKNRALNSALEEAEGDLFIFCDDDVVPSANWLEQWRAVADAKSEYLLFSGRVEPVFPFQPPDWILDDVDRGVIFAVNDDWREGECSALGMYGTNMAIRSQLFEEGLRFNENIGPNGTGDYPMGSETELGKRLEAKGLRCWFSERPLVGHLIRREQMEPLWILRRGYRWGRGLAHMGIPYYVPGSKILLKNKIRNLLYPLYLPVTNDRDRWRRQWWWMVERGYEDGMCESKGIRPHWRNENGPILTFSLRYKLPKSGAPALPSN